MAEPVFLLHLQLGHGVLHFGQVKNRIVTKTKAFFFCRGNTARNRTGKSFYFGRNIGKFILILASVGHTVWVDADFGFRELGGAAFPAFPADKAGQHFPPAP
mgnify:CR=1 FL=1